MPGIRMAFVLLALGATLPAARADTPPNLTVASAESAFLDYLDAVGAAGYIESGGATSYRGKELAAWKAQLDPQRKQLDEALARIESGKLGAADRDALAAMRKSVTELETDDTTAGVQARTCADAQRRDLDYSSLRAALVSCYVEHGNRLQHDGGTIDRGTALQLLHVVDDRASRRAIFDAFVPLWTALNGRGEADSPYRRMIALAAAEARKNGSEIDAAARAIGVTTMEVERWLVQVLAAWRDANPADPIEPWDFRYVNGAANRELQARIPAAALLPVNQRFFRDLGADLVQLGIVFDLEPRPDKSPLAYSDFLVRGRMVQGEWHRPVARVLGTYPVGGLFSLNELVHENGHAVHVSAIRTRPAYMDWPDTLFTEAFADVPSWSVHEPAWQRRYLGAAVAESASMRALFANVMLDAAWSLFELRLLRDPALDPNEVWTDITHAYLRVVPHPEVPWWAMRVQLAGNPGYMVNYGLGALLTAEIRARTAAAIGPFDTGNRRWYAWQSRQLLHYGSERDTRRLLQDLLGRPLSPDALLEQIKRCGAHNP
ncbi:MAG: M3 family metallopeptidase [Gammaproteobacteria bacterium]|nr:M3 family metallopeptidase [Gammaproteobacteria bacterium]